MKSGASRILADENISPRVVAFLRTNGFDVSDVKEAGLVGIVISVMLLKKPALSQPYDLCQTMGLLEISRREAMGEAMGTFYLFTNIPFKQDNQQINNFPGRVPGRWPQSWQSNSESRRGMRVKEECGTGFQDD